MAAAPPPYSPRDQQRLARDYARAQREAARAQRYHWSCSRRRSIVGPLVLLAVGIVALLLETHRLNPGQFWGWYSRWWPLLLIGVGVLSLGEWFLERRRPFARGGSTAGAVFLIFLLASVGWSVRHAHLWTPLHEQFGGDSDGFFSFMGEEHENDTVQQFTLPASAVLQIVNPRGDVTLSASSDGQMHVRAHQVVHGREDKAQSEFRELKPAFQASGTSAVLSVPSRNDARVDLVIESPQPASAAINCARGDVSITGLRSSADVTTGHGDVKFDNVTGDVHARIAHGDFSAHQVGGHVFVDGRGGDVTISDASGNIVINGEFFGDTHIEQAGGTVHFHSSRTDLELPKLSGDLTMDANELHIAQPGGPMRISTRSKDIEITQLAGDAHIENANGEINLAAALPLGNLVVQNRNGQVSVTVPENAAFVVKGSTTGDEEVETEFPATSVSQNGDRKMLSGQVGEGGPVLQLTTQHASLILKKGGTGSLPAVPAPPRPPAPARGPHLRGEGHPEMQ